MNPKRKNMIKQYNLALVKLIEGKGMVHLVNEIICNGYGLPFKFTQKYEGKFKALGISDEGIVFNLPTAEEVDAGVTMADKLAEEIEWINSTPESPAERIDRLVREQSVSPIIATGVRKNGIQM